MIRLTTCSSKEMSHLMSKHYVGAIEVAIVKVRGYVTRVKGYLKCILFQRNFA